MDQVSWDGWLATLQKNNHAKSHPAVWAKSREMLDTAIPDKTQGQIEAEEAFRTGPKVSNSIQLYCGSRSLPETKEFNQIKGHTLGEYIQHGQEGHSTQRGEEVIRPEILLFMT